MLKLPVKKCFFLAKVCVLLMLVVTILSLFEQWRGGKRAARAQFTDAMEEEYERQILEDEARIIPGLGEGGAAAYLSPAEKALGAASEKKYAINTYLSDRISFNRTLKGYRGQDPASEFVYLKEIILVDDNSTLPALRGKLSHYVRTRLPPGLVRVVRLPDRSGLIRARQTGARVAKGDVLVFLDSHCEGAPDWLRPLLQRLKHAPHAVVKPIIDMVEAKTFEYEHGSNAVNFEVIRLKYTVCRAQGIN
ncbi:hypothetical protein MSG28_015250 [Choristoneura fumiferana]|uniref:Uncharacterized protein n=1 Tax=Choristoneura fumiferana TaxID=7141 RepID=A0ACC0L033_CHOFU|nr:hypothetical protein MSG28_015250 [Choristoneura fumiferana]